MADVDPFAHLYSKYSAPNYTVDVAQWAHDRLGVYLYSLQRQIGNDAAKNVLVRSCHDSGKTFLGAVKVCHWIDTHPVGTARVVTTAPTGDQVRGLLWNEINALCDRAAARGQPLPGRVNQTEWWIGNYQAGVGRKPGDYDQQHMSGWHAPHLLVVVDEADGIPAELWGALDTLMTSAGSRLFAIGNPDDRTSYFAKMQTDADHTGDKVYRIAAWDTPNFSGEEVPRYLQDVLLQRSWVEDKRVRWGGPAARLGYSGPESGFRTVDLRDPVDHPFWWSKVEAEYPEENELTIIRAADMGACMFPMEERGELVPVRGPVALGVDVAGSEGGDETVVRERVGPFMMREWSLQSGDDDAVFEFIKDKAIETGCGTLVIDVTGGYGWGFVGRLRRELPRVALVEFNFGASAEDKEHYKNARAELYWRGREAARDRKWCWAYAENADVTVAELTSVRKVPGTKVLQVESKADVKRRLGKSPDHADAALLAAWRGATGGEAHMHSARQHTLPTGSGSVVRGGASILPTGAAGVVRR